MSRRSPRLSLAALALATTAGAAAPTASTMKGLVASAHPAASEAGAQVLRQGGNALDAAVATAYVLSVVEPYAAGVGGGGFVLYREAATGQAWVVDYREVAPRRARRDMYLVDGKADAKMSVEGILAVAVPGMVPGLAEAQKKLGRLQLKDALDGAIALADKGFAVTTGFRADSLDRLAQLRANPAAAAVFLKNGEAYAVGDKLVQPDLAKTLRALKREGPRLFTHGAVAQAMARESRRLGGILERRDLENFKPRWREPLVGSYRGFEILTMPPPSSGGTHLLQILKLLDIDRRRRPERSASWQDPANLHVLAECMRRAFADRAVYMGDPAFTDVPVKGLLADAYLEARYASIDLDRATPSSVLRAGEVGMRPEPRETTNVTVIDKDGNVAVLTQTVNYGFGAGVVVPGTGVLLNNEMDDFSAAPGSANVYGLVGGEANSIAPGKIPLSSMTPTIVLENGKLRLALGSPGGPTIITTVLQLMLHILDEGLDPDTAMAAPRVHHQWLPDELRVERGALSAEVRAALVARGHVVVDKKPWGNATAIEVRRDGLRVAAADPRGEGAVAAE